MDQPDSSPENGLETGSASDLIGVPVSASGMMQFRRLKLSGFKSFVEPAELHIEPGLTGIVGPNGCGKSNLLEAIRWVMGENSAKSMRGGGMEDVIFAGTANRPARNFAEVSLLAEVSSDALTIASDTGGELEVVRRIERGAGSAYRANGRDVRAKDIALIFADAATGAHSPALVSQGKISGVISARPTERRQMLEEAAGIAGLHVRRKDAEQKLRAAETNLGRLEQILGDMDARANALRRQARTAEKYRALSKQIMLAEARTLFARWREAALAAEAALKQARDAESAVAAAQIKVGETQSAQQAAIQTLADARAAAQLGRERSGTLAHQLATVRAERQSVEQRLADLQRQAERLTEDAAREEKLTHDAADALARLEDEAAKLDSEIAAQETKRPEYVRALDRSETVLRDCELALAKANAEQARAEADIKVAESALGAARARLARCQQELARNEARLAELGDRDALKAAQAAAKAETSAQAEHAANAQQAITKAEAARGALVEQRDTTQAELAAERAQLHALNRQIEALERELSARSDTANQAIEQIRAETGYEKALAAALGDELAGVVGPAQTQGRFWTGAALIAPRKTLPAGWVRLAEHVSAPPQLAARLALVFVCDAHEDASGAELAPGERLVTRDGRLLRWDGYVASGDGASAAERLARKNQLDALRAERPSAEKRVSALSETLSQSETALAALQEQLATARQMASKAEAAARDALRTQDQADNALARDQERREELTQRIAALRSEHDAASEDAKTAEAARSALPDGGAQRAAVIALENQSDAARQALASQQAVLSTLDQGLAASRERRAAVRADIRGWQARSGEAIQRLRAMQSRSSELDIERLAIADRPAALQQVIAQTETDSTAAQAECTRLDSVAKQAEADLRTAEQAAALAAEALASARETRAGAQARAENQDQRRSELARHCGERFSCPPPLLPERQDFSAEDVISAEAEAAQHDHWYESRERLGPVNLVAADELAALETEIATNRSEHEELTEAIRRLRGSIGSLNREGRQRLLAAFETVDAHFQRLFAQLFDGGKAHLALIDSDDPLEAGLEIMAQPPGKKLASLTLLSGGEQALTAIALIFALFLTNPAPICVLDEVDAPLDDANIERFCDLLDAMVRQTSTRYLIVTHNAVTMSRMHRLFGVTMIEKGVSRLVSVDLGGAEQLLAAE